MNELKHKPTLIIYGATAFTGRQVVEYLDTHPDRDEFDVIISGRNAARLDGVKKGLKRDYKVVVLDLGDEQGVGGLVRMGEVVVNLAGPYRWHNASSIISACASTGTHYLDLSGESSWLETLIIPKYDYLASTTGSIILPSCGFDTIPGDIVLYSALSTLQNQTRHANVVAGGNNDGSEQEIGITKHTAFYDIKGGLAGGTVQTMYSVAELPSEERNSDEWSLVSGQGPSQPPRLSYTLTHPSFNNKTLHGAFFAMYPYNRCIIRRSWFLSRLSLARRSSPPHSKKPSGDDQSEQEPRHVDGLVYQEALQVPSRFWAVTATVAMGVFGLLFFTSKWTRWLVGSFLPKSGTGPSEETMRNGHTNITAVSQTTRPGTSVVTSYKGQSDPGYRHTSYILSEAALSLLLPPPKGTSLPPLAKIGGVLTPSTALGSVLLQRLRSSGKVIIESKVYEDKHKDL
ncbi:Saccharopine dehydrogenase-domain-containing protein [Naematelia encephala]|uniref:Saccharopine dehydrogenase-domain-containing protein n=1 Tax=Naematelia encephala TaxID=71784 RepID=A0A1Y2B9V7_9TREE|nr:Saccharopine dehydrogenase-domain-containing protein [Naematelia encephala]